MAGGAVILREVTAADYKALTTLANKVFSQDNLLVMVPKDRFLKLKTQGFRIVCLFDPNLVAALVACPLKTDKGAGFEIVFFLVDKTRPDTIDLADALTLWSLNVAQSEGYLIVVTRVNKSIAGTIYARDVLNMETTDDGSEWVMVDTMKTMASNILKRHPEWRTLP